MLSVDGLKCGELEAGLGRARFARKPFSAQTQQSKVSSPHLPKDYKRKSLISTDIDVRQFEVKRVFGGGPFL